MKYLLILLSFSVLTLFSCSEEKSEKITTERVSVTLVEVQKKVHTPVIRAGGVLASKSELLLSFKTGGIIEKIMVDEGQSVKKGQILARLDLSEIRARYRQAEEAHKKAQRDVERMEVLYRDSVVTREQWQNVNTALEVAKSDLEIAQFNLKYSNISAPSDGRILRRFVDENELVAPGNPVILFGSLDTEWVVRTGISDQQILTLELGDSARVRFDAYPGKIFTGLVSEIAAAADPASGTFEVELRLEDTSMPLLSGFVAKLEILPSSRKTMAHIPIQALSEAEASKGFVYVPGADNTIARKKPVTVAAILDSSLVISSGLEGIDHVIASGTAYLIDKTPIVVLGKPAALKNKDQESAGLR